MPDARIEQYNVPTQQSSAALEFENIKRQCPVLASTGCNADFCQSGRMLHTDEPRVGENRPIEVVMNEAEQFLREMLQGGLFSTIDECEERIRVVHAEICSNSRHGIIPGQEQLGFVGGIYYQSTQELEFGLRRSWRNARKCIMRSQHETLVLKDLRHITSSLEMANEVIKGMQEAFNKGSIRPTTFVFPARTVDQRGPMIISQQLLAFAGYKMNDGSILGDPANVQLTKDIIELGWTPPEYKTRWDLLPFVTLAENAAPAIVELPLNLQKLVQIRHPRYESAFEDLDLKWVAAPALSRLGFDIGGVQYTATPFIGWFMDAEIGVRNLADSFRYNVLPDVVKALKLEGSKDYDDMDDLPEYEKLALLSRAQAELTYAVTWSFQNAGVSISDSFTASANYIEFDDAFKAKHGYRLPSDPYWLAPPQGSIVPIWHRGGAPNYQPKPLIAKHVLNPMKAWRREKNSYSSPVRQLAPVSAKAIPNQIIAQSISVATSITTQFISNKLQGFEALMGTDSCHIAIHYCTAGTTARKLADKLHKKIAMYLAKTTSKVILHNIATLDAIEVDELGPNTLLLLVVSSTGFGDIPANGQAFYNACKLRENSTPKLNFRFSLFGNGDSRYADSYNGGALKVLEALNGIGGTSLGGSGFFDADTALEPVPTQALDRWFHALQQPYDAALGVNGQMTIHDSKGNITIPLKRGSIVDPWTLLVQQLKILTAQFVPATIVDIKRGSELPGTGSMIVTLDVGATPCVHLGCIQVLPVNSPAKVETILSLLNLDGSEWLDLSKTEAIIGITNKRFFAELVDLEAPFSDLAWISQLKIGENIPEASIDGLGSFKVLQYLQSQGLFPEYVSQEVRKNIILSMRLLTERVFSVASSAPVLRLKGSQKRTCNEVDIMVKSVANGRFSDAFLSACSLPVALQVRSIEAACTRKLTEWTGQTHMVAIATGAGFGPVRALLQRQIGLSREKSMSVFVGVKACDVSLISDVLDEAAISGIADVVDIVPSNENKLRIQDRFLEPCNRQHLKKKIEGDGALVFICSGQIQATEIIRKLDEVVDGEIRVILGERLILEVY
ncbi:hypothetical protein BT63DRAFT_396259 [Microthyrium microscopicum]|uniref:nitric-oxide synthase (NADPH) n=1 Tax=Microthyrium microscopicum TaxID=703497 RepID=A0A6A6UK28_9PEZI|nr:hypothetical protein BT63DRAFT_396259 [Microthyrium microscopicum]